MNIRIFMAILKFKADSMILIILTYLTLVMMTWFYASGVTYAQMNSPQNNESISSPNSMPTAQSVFETGIMSLPKTVGAAIIFIPDESHHPPTDDKTISPMNPNYLPNTLIIPEGVEIAFVHDDPSHTHVGIVKDNKGNVIWTTIPVEYPDASDTKTLSISGSPYSISDEQYSPPMKGKIVVTADKSFGALTVGGFFCPTKLLSECKSQLSSAGFDVLSEHNFETRSVQKDISGPNTLVIYSTVLPMNDALTNLGPIIKSLPYK
jgi:hypothetical protein